ncbi:MAG: preprotein translocase subunit SecG [Thermoguttaceae bacterium]|nr:preprotein translocase subunit SecG [Thermoguttaceae bacterium]MDW8078962.1 preprotein translocase subunit SecG [Thermoguttaceae bacterium]
MAALIETLVMILLFFLAILLIIVILLQRGRGGGLAGLAGGLATQNPFGTKAGDIFTRITIVLASIWILLCLVSVRLLGTGRPRIELPAGQPAQSSPVGTEQSSTTAPSPAAPSDSSPSAPAGQGTTQP